MLYEACIGHQQIASERRYPLGPIRQFGPLQMHVDRVGLKHRCISNACTPKARRVWEKVITPEIGRYVARPLEIPLSAASFSCRNGWYVV